MKSFMNINVFFFKVITVISEGHSAVASFVLGFIKPDIQVVLHAV